MAVLELHYYCIDVLFVVVAAVSFSLSQSDSDEENNGHKKIRIFNGSEAMHSQHESKHDFTVLMLFIFVSVRLTSIYFH